MSSREGCTDLEPIILPHCPNDPALPVRKEKRRKSTQIIMMSDRRTDDAHAQVQTSVDNRYIAIQTKNLLHKFQFHLPTEF